MFELFYLSKSLVTFTINTTNLKFLFLIISFFLFNKPAFSQNIDSLLSVLEHKMEKQKVFDKAKKNQIKILLEGSSKNNAVEEKIRVNNELFKLYQYYNFDNSLKYIEKNIELAEQLNNKILINDAKLKMSMVLVNTGRYKESIDALSEIDRNSLQKPLFENYFYAFKEGYSGLAFSTSVKSRQSKYYHLYNIYKDSLYLELKPNSDEALRLKEKEFRDSRNIGMAFKINNKRLEKVSIGTRLFSLITFERSLLHEMTGNQIKQKEYLILSAISDIQASVKDNASLGTLAKILFNEGDIDRAYRYINFSYDDAEFFNSNLRFVNIANTMPLITKAYENKSAKQKKQLQELVISIGLLSIFLIFAIYSVYKQVVKVSKARNELKILNEDLKNLYDELSKVDKIKEHYIGSFLNLYSEYISKLDSYRKLVSKYVNSNQMNALLKLSKSKQLIDEELEIFNKNFDESFLHIHPNFIESVNKLLKPENQLSIHNSSKLNTELRILALIKLGITRSSNIAKILRFSVNTIYNYRAAINNRALDKDTFEDSLKNI